MDQYATWYGGRPLPRPDCVRWDPAPQKRGHSSPQFSDAAPFPKKGHSSPQFSAHVCCGQTAGWIKMPLGTDHIVLHGDLAPPKRVHSSPPIFGPCVLWPNGWIDQHATWYKCRPRPRRLFVLDGDPSSQKGAAAPHFSAHVYCGQNFMVAHLSYCWAFVITLFVFFCFRAADYAGYSSAFGNM